MNIIYTSISHDHERGDIFIEEKHFTQVTISDMLNTTSR